MTGQKKELSGQHNEKNIDEYLQKIPVEMRTVLNELRETIRAAVPGAEEAFVYGVPGFKINGKSLVCYAGFKNHCGFYPMSPQILNNFAGDLKSFETSKGTIRIQPEMPLPASIVIKIVKARLAEILDSESEQR